MRQKVSTLTALVLIAGLLPLAGIPGATAQEEPPLPLPDPVVVPYQVSGPASERMNLIILGDGYQWDQQSIFHEDVDRNLAVMFATEPYKSYRDYLNIYAVELSSIDYGVRCDPDGRVRHPDGTIRDTGQTEGPINTKNTALRMIFSNGCNDPLARGTVYTGAPPGCAAFGDYYPPGVNPCESGAQARSRILNNFVAPVLGISANSQNVQTLVVFNTFTYGGIGGTHATTSGGSPQGPWISLHELGHSHGSMADEYPYSSRDVVRPCYPGSNDNSFHHTLLDSAEDMLAAQTKWWRWLGEESLSGGTIDLYEGGRYYPCGYRRPSEHSIMRWIGNYWDQVGLEHMVARITGLRNTGQMPLPALEAQEEPNLATDASVSCSYTSPWESCSALNSGNEPSNSNPSSGRWGTWPNGGSQWVQLTWSEPRTISVADLYWFQDSSDGSNSGVKRPAEWDLEYFDGAAWQPVSNPSGYGTQLNQFNRTTFDAVTTTGLRANVETRSDAVGVGALEFQVYTEPPVDGPPAVGRDEVLWVKPLQPRSHGLQVTWRVGGSSGEVLDTGNAPFLALGELDLEPGTVVHVEVRDPVGPDGIDWVRNPSTGSSSTNSGYNGPRFVQTRQWTVGSGAVTPSPVGAEVTNATPNSTPVAGTDWVFVETNQPADRVLDVAWFVDGDEVANPNNLRNIDVGALGLASGTYDLTVVVTDPADPAASDSRSWVVDNVLPTAPRTLSESLTTLDGDLEHPVYFDGWDMWLDPTDDTTGYDEERFVVGELRLNGDGWFGYYGFPEEPMPESPFQFRHSGQNVKALTYGNLGSGGLSKATFEQFFDGHPSGTFEPGYGTHLVEHRAVDAAGNIGDADAYRATALPGGSPDCTTTITGDRAGPTIISGGVTCVAAGVSLNGPVTVRNGGSLVLSDGATINGGLRVNSAGVVHLFGATVNGDSHIRNVTDDVIVAGSRFNGDLDVAGNSGLEVTILSGATRQYGILLIGNTISQTLSCTDNAPFVNDFDVPNTAAAKSGQCTGV